MIRDVVKGELNDASFRIVALAQIFAGLLHGNDDLSNAHIISIAGPNAR
jgi:hypothetical protein